MKKVIKAWKEPHPTITYSMVVKKGSPYFPFIVNAQKKLFESGIWNYLRTKKQHEMKLKASSCNVLSNSFNTYVSNII